VISGLIPADTVAGRTIDIGGEPDPVACPDDEIPRDEDIAYSGHIHSTTSSVGVGPSLACRPQFGYTLVPTPTVVTGA